VHSRFKGKTENKIYSTSLFLAFLLIIKNGIKATWQKWKDLADVLFDAPKNLKGEVQQNFGISNFGTRISNFRFYRTTVNGPATINANVYCLFQTSDISSR